MRPLLKVNPPASPSDTRPIANLRELSKIFERVVHRRITDFIVADDVLDSRDSGVGLARSQPGYGGGMTFVGRSIWVRSRLWCCLIPARPLTLYATLDYLLSCVHWDFLIPYILRLSPTSRVGPSL